jgi:hypothetical protein
MSRGGSRPNAGRKSKSRELLIERSRNVAAQASITPLEYLLQIAQDTGATDKRRFAAAVAAAPYVHPRLAAVEHSGNQDKPVVTYQIITGYPARAMKAPTTGKLCRLRFVPTLHRLGQARRVASTAPLKLIPLLSRG